MHGNKLPDNELILKIKEDQIWAFDCLFLRYYKKLCFYAYRITQKKEIAEEIVQDLFVKIWESRKVLKIEKSVNSYLYRSTFNLATNAVRDNKKFANQINIEEVPLNKVSYENADNEILFNELEIKLFKVIDSFSKIQRDVFILKRFEGYTYHEISLELNISEKMVEKYLSKALKTLKDEISKIDQPIPIYFYLFI